MPIDWKQKNAVASFHLAKKCHCCFYKSPRQSPFKPGASSLRPIRVRNKWTFPKLLPKTVRHWKYQLRVVHEHHDNVQSNFREFKICASIENNSRVQRCNQPERWSGAPTQRPNNLPHLDGLAGSASWCQHFGTTCYKGHKAFYWAHWLVCTLDAHVWSHDAVLCHPRYKSIHNVSKQLICVPWNARHLDDSSLHDACEQHLVNRRKVGTRDIQTNRIDTNSRFPSKLRPMVHPIPLAHCG